MFQIKRHREKTQRTRLHILKDKHVYMYIYMCVCIYIIYIQCSATYTDSFTNAYTNANVCSIYEYTYICFYMQGHRHRHRRRSNGMVMTCPCKNKGKMWKDLWVMSHEMLSARCKKTKDKRHWNANSTPIWTILEAIRKNDLRKTKLCITWFVFGPNCSDPPYIILCLWCLICWEFFTCFVVSFWSSSIFNVRSWTPVQFPCFRWSSRSSLTASMDRDQRQCQMVKRQHLQMTQSHLWSTNQEYTVNKDQLILRNQTTNYHQSLPSKTE